MKRTEKLIALDESVISDLEPENPDLKTVKENDYFHFDSATHVSCPRYQSTLRTTYFKKDPSVWVEICDHCRGSFYGFGELGKVLSVLK